MAQHGFQWGAFAFMQKSAGNWSADAIADNATETGDETSLDGKAACQVGFGAVEAAGAIDGVVTVFVLGDADGTNFEETTIGTPMSFTFTPVQSDTVYKVFNIDPGMYPSFKLAFFNESGQSIAFTVKFRTATFGTA